MRAGGGYRALSIVIMRDIIGGYCACLSRWIVVGVATLTMTVSPLVADDLEPGSWWLWHVEIEPWELDVDADGDGMTAREEYFSGTDPWVAESRLSLDLGVTKTGTSLLWASAPGVAYELMSSEDLASFEPVGGLIPGTGEVLKVPLSEPLVGQVFFQVRAATPRDEDADGLSSVEEGILGTRVDLSDTDGDGFPDGREVLEYFTDPLVFDSSGGTIRGVVRTDPDRNGDTLDGEPVAEVVVWLDADCDGLLDEAERRTVTDAAGAYAFPLLAPGFYHVRQLLRPGSVQTLPAEVTPPLPDGWADEVVSYVHADTGLDFSGPYGLLADRVWPGQRWVVVAYEFEAVDPAILLKPAGNRYEVPPIGIYNTTECLSLPRDASVTVRFAEAIVDGEGADLALIRPRQGSSSELAEVWMGADLDGLMLHSTVDQAVGDSVLALDLAGSGVQAPVHFVRLISRTSAGTDQAVAFTGLQALNYVAVETDARAVTIVAGETVDHQDFGQFFRDNPPVLLLETGGAQTLRQGRTSRLRVVASDDLGLMSVSAEGNGVPLDLGSDGSFSLTPAEPGVLNLTGSATDTGGQVSREYWTLYVEDAEGNLPFDPAVAGSGDTEDIRVWSPVSGAVVSGSTPIVATIGGTSAPSWEVAYAPVDRVDPYDLEAEDPDYVVIASGTGYRVNEAVASFPGDEVGSGIYFLRVKAAPSLGGPVSYIGQVIAKGVDPESLQPVITILSPNEGTSVTLLQEVFGTIQSSRPLVEWHVDVAPRGAVDFSDLGGDQTYWKRIGEGTEASVAPEVLARMDATVLPNGSYVVRVVAWNDLRLGRVEARLLEVTGETKLGRHRREFTDVEVELAGFPLRLSRVYDSFAASEVGDFGYGWSLAWVNPQISETVPRTGVGVFGATAFRDGTRVYLTGPDGRRNGFTFRPELVSPGLLGPNYRAVFVADPGVYDRLEVPEGAEPFLTVNPEGEMIYPLFGFSWNPDTYVLVRPDGSRYTYHETRGFLEAEDLAGNRLTYSEDGIEHSGGLRIEFTRDDLGRIASISMGGSQVWSYAYTPAGDLRSVEDPSGAATTYGYLATPEHFLASVTDAYGRVGSSYEYDSEGRLVAVVDAAGNRTLQSWDPEGFTGSTTDALGYVTEITYDRRGNVLTATDPLGGVDTYAYEDGRHPDKPTRWVDALGRETRYVYDDLGNTVSVTRPPDTFSPTERWTYNARGQPLTFDADGGRTERWEYDERGNLTLEGQAFVDDPVIGYTYTPQGLVETETLDGETTRTEYDGATGLSERITDTSGLRLSYTRDTLGRITSTTTSSGEEVTITYHANGVPASMTDSSGGSAGSVINTDGSITVTDWNGRSTRFYADANGQLTAVRGPEGFTAAPVRDANGNVRSLEDPLSNLHQAEYDPLNRLTRYTDPNGRWVSFSYDAVGRVTERVDRNGRKKRWTWNQRDLVTEELWLDAEDRVVRTWTFTYSSGGFLRSVSDGSSVWEFLGTVPTRPVRVRVVYAGQSRFDLLYDWIEDGTGVPTRVRLDDSADVGLDGGIAADRRSGGMIHSHQWELPELPGASQERHVRHYYDTMGNETRLERFKGAVSSDIRQVPFALTDFSRDSKGRVTGISHRSFDSTLLFPGASMNLTRTAGGVISHIAEPDNVASLAYDEGLQLTGVVHTARVSERYSFDASVNRLSSHFQAGLAAVEPGNRLREAGELAFENDFEGNLTRETHTGTGAIREFTYDHNNQLVLVQSRTSSAASPVTVAEYEYDWAGRLIRRAEGGATRWVLYDREMPFAEFDDGEDSIQRMYFYDLGKLDRWFAVWDANEGERWFLQDHRGSVRGVFGVDASDASPMVAGVPIPIVWADYDAFGQIVSGDPVQLGNLRFAGRFWSEAAGLYENRSRHYSPYLGRFMQEDPTMFEGGDLNFYRYAGNDPHNRTDPTGEVAAVEYKSMLSEVAQKTIDDASRIGKCVCKMFGAAAVGLQGVQTSGAGDCVLELAPRPKWPKFKAGSASGVLKKFVKKGLSTCQ